MGEKEQEEKRKEKKPSNSTLHGASTSPAERLGEAAEHETMHTCVAGKGTRGKKNKGKTAAHQHAVVAVLVKEHHASLRRYGDLLLGHPAVVGEEDRLTAFATLGLRGQVQEKRPCCLGPDRALCRLDGNLVRVVIYGFAVIVSRERDRPGACWLRAGMKGNRAILGRWGAMAPSMGDCL